MNFQEFMKEKGLTKEKLSEISGTSESTIKRALKGKNINTTSMTRLASTLKVSEDELKSLIQAPPSSDYISVLVHRQLHKLKDLGLEFKPPPGHPDSPVYLAIEDDLRKGRYMNYFPDAFDTLVKTAGSQSQLEAFKELAMYCAAYLVDRDFDLDMKHESLFTLSGGENAWELRIFINTAIEKLEGLECKLTVYEETGLVTLPPVERAHRVGLSASTEAMELLLDIAKQINAQEPLTDKKCPDQLRRGNDQDMTAFKSYCDELNQHLGFYRNSLRNIFAFSEQTVPQELTELLAEYLPALRMMIIKADGGTPFLVEGNKIHVVLTNLLKGVVKREIELFGKSESREATTMTGKNTFIFKEKVDTLVAGDFNRIEIREKFRELIPVLQEMKQLLSPVCPTGSEEMTALDHAAKQTVQSKESLETIKAALDKVKNLIKTGSSVANLYQKAESLLRELLGAIS